VQSLPTMASLFCDRASTRSAPGRPRLTAALAAASVDHGRFQQTVANNAAIRVERRPGRHGRDRRRGRLAGAGPAWSGGSEPSEPILRPPRAGSEFSQALLSQRGGLIGPSPKDRRRPRLSGCGTLDLNARSLAVIVCLRHSDSVDISAYAPICICMHLSEARRT